jgi:hypothetical protein
VRPAPLASPSTYASSATAPSHLLGLQVRVVVRDRHRQRVEVELARTERADHEVPSLEGLVRGRRLVDAACDRLEVVHRERPRVEEAVPGDGLQRLEAGCHVRVS